MKKLFTLMLAFLMIFAFVACDNSDDDDDDDDKKGSKITVEQLQQNAEDMGFVAERNPTSTETLQEVEYFFADGLADVKDELSEATDEEVIAYFGEELGNELIALRDAELKGGVTFAGSYENPVDDDELQIFNFENASDAKIMATVAKMEDDAVVVVEGNILVVAFASESVANAVINGAEKVESVNGMDAEELYNAEYERVSNATSITAYTTQDVVLRLSELGAGYDQTMVQSATTILAGDDQYGYTESSENGSKEYWYVDGVFYLVTGGQRVKGALDLDAYAQKLGMQNAKQGLINVPADWFKGVELKTVDGTYFMVMTVKGEKYTEMVGNAIGDAYEAQGIAVQISDVAYRVYLDENGSIDYIVADYQIYLTMQGQKITADVYQRTEVYDINSSVIPSIENPDLFTEVDLEGALGLK